MMINTFHLMLKALFILNIFNVGKQLGKKVKVNFKVYDATDWETNNCNTHIAQYLTK